jgi:hypothetical protein
MIDEPGHPAGTLRDPFRKEPPMLKTISAALLAVSVLAAPVMAAGTTKTAQAPVTKSATVTKPAAVKNPLNANAKMGHHHKRHVSHYNHHRSHKVAAKHHKSLKVSAKPVLHPAKRG